MLQRRQGVELGEEFVEKPVEVIVQGLAHVRWQRIVVFTQLNVRPPGLQRKIVISPGVVG